MLIWSNKKLEFVAGDEKFVTTPLVIENAPDGIRNTLLFRLAQQDGSIKVMDGAKALKKAEAGEHVKARKLPSVSADSKE